MFFLSVHNCLLPPSSRYLRGRLVFIRNTADKHNGQPDDKFSHRSCIGISALNTTTPFLVADFRSTWFTPIQKQPIACSFLAASSTFFVICVLERIPSICTSLISRISSSSVSALLILVHPGIIVLTEILCGHLADILQEENTYFFFGITGFSFVTHTANMHITVDK